MVRFVPMTENEFQAYRKNAIEEYAQDHVRAGNWHPAEALEKAEKEFQHLLPDGVASKNQYLYALVDAQTGAKVGRIWFSVNDKAPQPTAFIYDFLIDEHCRRRGYGRQALGVLEEKARELGIDTVSLHVFGRNQAAIALYQKVGYEITNLVMTKKSLGSV
ncbi:MAG: GNAT family N-acetyltransferase [Chloroflexi bacterium]|nr:GNAT family N-acetyltransferase [Chloroflexota bacterium]